MLSMTLYQMCTPLHCQFIVSIAVRDVLLGYMFYRRAYLTG